MSVWGGSWDLMALMTSPAQNRAARVYELIGMRLVLGEQSLFLNLGYWDGAQTYDAACTRLAEVLGEAAGLGPEDELLDCGFGFGRPGHLLGQALQPEENHGPQCRRRPGE